MNHSDEYGEGFLFALHVLDSMGRRPPIDDIVAQLVSVANGQMSLMPTPEEAVKGIEHEHKKKLPDTLKASVRSLMGDRAAADADHRASAVFILRMMGELPDEK